MFEENEKNNIVQVDNNQKVAKIEKVDYDMSKYSMALLSV